jgi:hypothetical protein
MAESVSQKAVLRQGQSGDTPGRAFISESSYEDHAVAREVPSATYDEFPTGISPEVPTSGPGFQMRRKAA